MSLLVKTVPTRVSQRCAAYGERTSPRIYAPPVIHCTRLGTIGSTMNKADSRNTLCERASVRACERASVTLRARARAPWCEGGYTSCIRIARPWHSRKRSRMNSGGSVYAYSGLCTLSVHTHMRTSLHVRLLHTLKYTSMHMSIHKSRV